MKPAARPADVQAAANQRITFYAQKREAFFVNALVGILHNPATKTDEVETNTDLALKYADTMFNRLYVPVKAEAKAEDKK